MGLLHGDSCRPGSRLSGRRRGSLLALAVIAVLATLTEYGSCPGNGTVELYAVSGEGHEWPDGPAMPGAITKPLGPQTDAINANATMWAFFQAHPMPA